MSEQLTKKEDSKEHKRDSRVLVLAAFIVLAVGGGIGAFAYFAASSKTVYIENAQVSAPLTTLSSASGGTLRAVFVSEGQTIAPNTVVAQVDTELIKSTQGGLVLTTNDAIGKQVQANSPIVTMVDPLQLRVVGQVQEDKGLVAIHAGDPVAFTVDAFGSKKFAGVVESVAPTSKSSDVVFSVSDKREEQDFDVKVDYGAAAHPEIKNGMSAELWVYKQ